MRDGSARLAPVVSYLSAIFLLVAVIGFLTTPVDTVGVGLTGAERAQNLLTQGVVPTLLLAFAGQVVFSVLLVLTVVAVYRNLGDQSIPAVFFIVGGVIFAGGLAFETLAIHLGAELELIRMFQDAPANSQADLVSIQRVVQAVHDAGDLLAYAFGFIAFASAAHLFGKNPKFARLPRWSSYAAGILSGLALISGATLGVPSQMAVAFLPPLMIAIGIWCFAVAQVQWRIGPPHA